LSEVLAVLNSFPSPPKKEIWSINLDPVSGSFFGAAAVGKDRPVAFLDNLPVTLWVREELKTMNDSGAMFILNI